MIAVSEQGERLSLRAKSVVSVEAPPGSADHLGAAASGGEVPSLGLSRHYAGLNQENSSTQFHAQQQYDAQMDQTVPSLYFVAVLCFA